MDQIPPTQTSPAPGVTLAGLDHYTVNGGVEDIDGLRDFYRDVLGLAEGPRPDFDFPGYWMYCAGQAIVHIVGLKDQTRMASVPTGAMDHISLRISGFSPMRAHLDRLGTPYEWRMVPGGRLAQIFVHDPMGVRLELTFPGSEATAASK